MIDVKTLRKEKGVSQGEMARDLNISLNTVRYWECGKCEPRATMAVKVAKYFGKTVEEIVK